MSDRRSGGDRRKGGLKRSVAAEGHGIPLGIASAGASRHDSPLLAPTLQAAHRQLGGLLPAGRTCHLDAGYDSQHPYRKMMDDRESRRAGPPPMSASTIQGTQPGCWTVCGRRVRTSRSPR